MKINPAIFKAYDIRGIYPQDINEENIEDIIKTIYTFFVQSLQKENLEIVLGRDMRFSSPALFAKTKKTLLKYPAKIVDIGLASTPTFYFVCLKYGYDAGIQISASHNPPEYNGIKFVKRVGERLVKIGAGTGMEEVKKIALSKNFIKRRGKGEVITKKDVLTEEIDFAFKLVNPKNIKKLKVVADPANAMGILFLEELFKRTPCKLIKMNFKLDGAFPAHQPDPLQFKTLRDLQKRVLKEKADLGIAPDGDGDRVFFIDEKGKIIPASLITSLISKEILSKKSGERILVDIRYTRNASKVCQDNGGAIIISRVGHALITEHLNREDGAFAGESSGHFFFRETGGTESSVRAILHTLEVMGREDKPISHILSQFVSSFESGEINFELKVGNSAEKVFTFMASEYKNGKISYLDGIAIDYPSWRFNIRASNTEPLIRLNVEGEIKNLTTQKVKELKEKIIRLGAKIKE